MIQPPLDSSVSIDQIIFEKHVVVAVRIERRIEIYKIDRLVLDIPPQNVQIIAVVKSIHWVK